MVYWQKDQGQVFTAVTGASIVYPNDLSTGNTTTTQGDSVFAPYPLLNRNFMLHKVILQGAADSLLLEDHNGFVTIYADLSPPGTEEYIESEINAKFPNGFRALLATGAAGTVAYIIWTPLFGLTSQNARQIQGYPIGAVLDQ